MFKQIFQCHGGYHILNVYNDSHLREGGTNLGCFPVGGGGGWLTTPTSPPVYRPARALGETISSKHFPIMIKADSHEYKF